MWLWIILFIILIIALIIISLLFYRNISGKTSIFEDYYKTIYENIRWTLKGGCETDEECNDFDCSAYSDPYCSYVPSCRETKGECYCRIVCK